jgi:hypothetical protein
MPELNLRKLGGCKPKSPVVRFHASYEVKANGCWMWLGTDRGSNRYGSITVDGRHVPAHRYAWQLFRGAIPDGLLVCHHCDTPKCVNPDHLFLGTHQDNVDDCKRKGRLRGGTKTPLRGEANVRSKLTSEAVRAIRADQRTLLGIAHDYGVSGTLIWRIKRNLIWRHI